MITQKELRDLFEYSPDTGNFVRRPRSIKGNIYKQCSHTNSAGYVVISVNGKDQYAHRLAWLYIHGHLPEQRMDHIDGNPANNRISNLRLVNHRINLINIHRGSRAIRKTQSGCFELNIQIKNKRHYLGCFSSRKEAEAAREAFIEENKSQLMALGITAFCEAGL